MGKRSRKKPAATFVTEDPALLGADVPGDQPAVLSDVDRKVMEQARTGEGAIELTPELMKELAEGAQKTMEAARRDARAMPFEAAMQVRELKRQRYSWRAIAEQMSKDWNLSWGSNQLFGMACCEEAARKLGERLEDPPWA